MRLIGATLIALLAGSACTPQEEPEAWQAIPVMNQSYEPNGNGQFIYSPQVAPAGPSHLGPTWRKGHPHQDILATIGISCWTDGRSGAAIQFNQEVTLPFGDRVGSLDLPAHTHYWEHTLAARIDGRDVTYKATQYPNMPAVLQLGTGQELLQEVDKARNDIAFLIHLQVGGYPSSPGHSRATPRRAKRPAGNHEQTKANSRQAPERPRPHTHQTTGQ